MTDAIDVLLAQHARAEEQFRLVRERTGEARRDAFHELVRLLSVHETIEEEVVHPLARRAIDAGPDVVEARLEEERDAKALLAQLADMDTDDPQFLPRLDAFRAAVLMHATREERYEFPQLRARVPQAELVALVPALRAAEALAPTRPHAGTESATANLLAGPPLAVLDRVRDLVRGALKTGDRKPDE
jgi:hypothetical protein